MKIMPYLRGSVCLFIVSFCIVDGNWFLFCFVFKLVKHVFINERLQFSADKHDVIKGFAINSSINDAKAVELFSVSLNKINC